MPKSLPSVEYLHKILRYDSATGFLYWRHRDSATFPSSGKKTSAGIASNWNSRWAGKRAFTQKDGNGYCQGAINRVTFKAAHIAWALTHGQWPQDSGFVLDHINGVRDDNRIVNLRLVTLAQNARNRRPTKANPSGVIGVTYSAAEKKWHARIVIHKKRVRIGRFDSFEEAVSARRKAELENGYAQHTRIESVEIGQS